MSKDFKDRKEIGPIEKDKFWQAHVVAWEQSGVSQAEYCRRQGLSVKIFGYWKRKFQCNESALTFVPVSIKPAQVTANKSIASLRLVIGSDYSVEISDGFKTETLRRLLDTLAGGV